MRIGLQTFQGEFLSPQRRPDLSKTDKEALIACESVHGWGRLSAESDLIRLIADTHAAQIADVFTDGQRAVHLVALYRFILVVLFDEGFCPFFELLSILFGPPAFERAVAVVFRTLVVETMTNLMTDDGTDGAVVDRIVGLHVEERRLQNRGGKNDFVQVR